MPKSVAFSRRAAPLAIAVAVVAAIGVVAVLLLRERTPLLSGDDLRAAARSWERRGMDDYTIVVRKDVDRLGTERFVTTVESGRATRMVMESTELAPAETYTVRGIFDTIERELEMAAEATPHEGQPKAAVLKARFDPELGLPVVFKRLASKSFILTIERFEVPGRGVLYPR